jgi:O-antigen/teichoic acid export membrane protein
MLMMLAIPVSVTFAVSAAPLIQVMYGAEFADAAPALAMAAPLLLLNCVVTFHLYQIVVPMGKEIFLVYIAATGASVSVVSNLLLIPVFGYHGAVVAALSAEVATLVVQFILIHRAGKNLHVFPTEVWKHLVAAGLLALTQAAGISAARGSLFGIGAVWAASAAIYGITLWILREPLIRQLTGRLAAFSRP